LSTKAKCPSMSRKPGMLEGGGARLATTDRLQERYDVETNSVWIGKRELIPVFVLKTIVFVRHPIVTPDAKPITCRICHLSCRTSNPCGFWLAYGRQPLVDFQWRLRTHCKKLSRNLLKVKRTHKRGPAIRNCVQTAGCVVLDQPQDQAKYEKKAEARR